MKISLVKMIFLGLVFVLTQRSFCAVDYVLTCAVLAEAQTRAPRDPVPPAQPVEQPTLHAPVPDPLVLRDLTVTDRADFSTASVILPTNTGAPTAAPANGQIITVDGILYTYDEALGKWLSVERQTVWAGRSGTVTNAYLNSFDSVSTRSTGYEMLRDATITGMTVASGGNAWLVASVGGDFTTLQAALASPSVVNGDVITIAPETFTLPAFSAPIAVNKSVSIIGCDGATIQTAGTANDPTTVLSVTVGNVFIYNMAIKQRKTTNSSIESAINVSAPAATGIIIDKCVAVVSMEFGIVINAAEFTVQNCDIRYEGPLGNNNRMIAVYRNSGVSRIINNRIFPSLDAPPSAPRSIFCYVDGAGPLSGTLIIDNNVQIHETQTTYLRQFYFQDAFTGAGFNVFITNNSYNDGNGGIVFYDSTNMLNLFSSIVVAGNSAANISGKGLITIDGFGAGVNPGSTTWYIADNLLANPGVFAPGFADETITPGLIGYNTSVFIPLSITYSTAIPPAPTPTPLFVLQARKNGWSALLAALSVMEPCGFSTDLNVDLSAGDRLQMFIQGTAINPTAGIEYAYRLIPAT